MTLFDADRMTVSRSPFGSTLRFVGPDGEYLGFGQPRIGISGIRLFSDSAGQEEVLKIHRSGLLNRTGAHRVIVAGTGEQCAAFHLNCVPQITWQIADAQQHLLGTVVAEYGDAHAAVIQFDDQVVCRVKRSGSFGGLGAGTWDVEIDKFAASPEFRHVILAAVLLLAVVAWPGGIVSKHTIVLLSWGFGVGLCVTGVGMIVVFAVLSANGGKGVSLGVYAALGVIAAIGLAMLAVRLKPR